MRSLYYCSYVTLTYILINIQYILIDCNIFSIIEPGGLLGQSALQAIDHFTLRSVKYISGMKSSMVKNHIAGRDDVNVHILDFDVIAKELLSYSLIEALSLG